MKLSRLAISLFGFACVFCTLLGAAYSASAAVAVGQKARDFSIPDAVTNDNVTLSALESSHKAVVLIFVSTQCPYSNAYNDRMEALTKEYGDRGVDVLGINSNTTESDQDVVEYKWEHRLQMQILKDANNVVADEFGATHTPEAYVIDPNGILVYHGRIDNSVELSGVKTHDLANALNAVLAGKAVPVPETKAFGCSIKRIQMQ
jgi:peroxiredoxin